MWMKVKEKEGIEGREKFGCAVSEMGCSPDPASAPCPGDLTSYLTLCDCLVWDEGRMMAQRKVARDQVGAATGH